MLALLNSDRAVVRKVLGGNLEAFRVLVERYAGVIHGVAFARLQNAADAEDVTQETFTRFYEQLDRMAHHKHIGPWLVHVARNACVDVARKRAREFPLDEARAAAHQKLPDPARQELYRLLYEQLQAMDVESREVLILFYFMKKRAKEIADLLEISTEAAAKRIQRARSELGRRLTDVLGDEIQDAMPNARRADPRLVARIMTAIAGTATAWKASAAGATAAATAAGIATGAGAAKLATAVAVLAAAAILGYLAYERYNRPFPTQDITAQSVIAVKEPQAETQRDNPEQVLPVPAAPEPDATANPAAAPNYTPIYGTIWGTVSLDDGTPAAGADVWVDNQAMVDMTVQAVKSGDLDAPAELVKLATRADATGLYRVDGVPLTGTLPGRDMVSARLEGYFAQVPLRMNHTRRDMELNITLYPAATTSGTVINFEGRPVPGASLSTESPMDQPSVLFLRGRGETGEDGRFVWHDGPRGPFRVIVQATGYLPYSGLLAGGSQDNVIQLDSGLSVSGRVVDLETTQPLTNVKVSGWGTRADLFFTGITDSAGRFTATGCASATYDLRLHAADSDPLRHVLVEPLTLTVATQPVTGLELKAARGAVLRGNVIDDETGSAPREKTGLVIGSKDNRQGASCKVAADGSYEIVGLPEGEFSVRAYCGLFYDQRQRYDGQVTLKVGEVREGFDIHLPRRPALAGTVLDDQNRPLPGASVYAIAREDMAGAVLSGVDGRFRLVLNEQESPSLRVTLQAIAYGGYSAPSGPYSIGSGKDDIVLRVARSGRLEGEVVDPAGRPLENFILSCVPESDDAMLLLHSPRKEISNGKGMLLQVRGTGSFNCSQLHPGKYTLEIYTVVARHPVAAATVNVMPGRTTTARLVVDTSWFGSIEGAVLMDGQPVPNRYVIFHPLDGDWLYDDLFAVTRADGSYAALAVAPGQVEVVVEAPLNQGSGGAQKKQTVNVVSGEVARADFIFEAGGAAAEGYVTVSGSPPPNGRVAFELVDATAQDAPRVFANTDPNGYYKVDGLQEGLYRVEMRYGGVQQLVEAQLTAGQTTRLDFNLESCGIRGVVTGAKPGEKTWVALFPGDAQLPEWSAEAIEALTAQALRYNETRPDGSFEFRDLQQGQYIVGAVALPAESQAEAQDILQGRIVASPIISVTPAAPAEVPLAFE